MGDCFGIGESSKGPDAQRSFLPNATIAAGTADPSFALIPRKDRRKWRQEVVVTDDSVFGDVTMTQASRIKSSIRRCPALDCIQTKKGLTLSSLE